MYLIFYFFYIQFMNGTFLKSAHDRSTDKTPMNANICVVFRLPVNSCGGIKYKSYKRQFV